MRSSPQSGWRRPMSKPGRDTRIDAPFSWPETLVGRGAVLPGQQRFGWADGFMVAARRANFLDSAGSSTTGGLPGRLRPFTERILARASGPARALDCRV